MKWSPTRRELLRTAGVGSAGVGAPAVGPGGSPAGLGNVSLENATDAVPDHPFAPTPEVEWSLDLGVEKPFFRRSSADGALYVGTPTGVRRLSTRGIERWRHSMASVDSDDPIAIHPGTGAVYAETRTGLYAFDAEDGHTQWRYAGDDGVAEAHVDVLSVTPETVFLDENGVTALAASDGREQWRFEPDDPVWIHPCAVGDTFYLGTVRGHLYAVDAADGTVRWHADRSDDGEPRFSVAGSTDDVVLAWDFDGGELYGFDAADGSLRWRFDANAEETGFPGTVRDDAVYLAADSLVRRLAVGDGTERWRYDAVGPVLRWSRFDDGTAYFGGVGGVHAVSTADGTRRWRFATSEDAPTYVVGRVDGTLVADAGTDALYGLDPERGRLRWRFGSPSRSVWLPQVGDDAVYLATESGTVHALSSPGPTPLYDAYRTLASPVSLAVGGVVGTALLAGAYRRSRRDSGESALDEPSESTAFADFELLDARTTATADPAAEVYDARTPSGERVVLTRFDPDAVVPDRFAAAVETWAALDFEGVLGVVAWATDPAPWVATERADATLAERAPDLTTAEVGRALADAAETLHRAHREGVVHGGLAPGDVWFADGEVGDGEADVEVRVGGWRLAAARRGESPDRRTDSAGSNSGVADLAPASDAHADSEAADVYRLAALADDLLGDDRTTGDDCFENRTESEDLAEVLARALADDPADRYDSALKFADALRWAVRE